MKEPYQKPKKALLEELGTSRTGLASREAEQRQEKYGPNELAEGKKKSPLLIFLEQFTDFLVLILIAAAVISIVIGDIESSIVILAVITMNAVLGTVQHVKAEHSLASLKQISAPMAKVLRDGAAAIIPSREVTVGDVVLLEAGDSVCADGRIVENASLKLNESALTGESLSAEKEDCTLEGDAPLGDRKNMVFSGSFVTYGRGSFVVTAVGMDTEVGKIAALLKSTAQKRTPLQENLDKFGKKLAVIIMVICVLVFGLNVAKGTGVMDSFMFAVALAVAAIPEALSSIVTIVLAFSTQKMVKENAIVRKLQAVEGLGSVSVICSDKTGTLTQNKMTVQHYYVYPDSIPDREADFSRRPDRRLLHAGILCSDATNTDSVEIGDPTELALINLAAAHRVNYEQVRQAFPRLAEVPFDSERKLMSVACQAPHSVDLIVKGAVDVLSGRLTHIETADGVRPITPADLEAIQAANRAYSERGLRVLAFGGKSLPTESGDGLARPGEITVSPADEKGLAFLGLIAMMDPPRPESKRAVEIAKRAGIRPIMITGDHKVTAAAIAEEIGILHDGLTAVEGSELDQLSDSQLQALVDRVAVYARVSPEHKIRIVNAWQEKGYIVSMTGDGVNDAPALKAADIGVAMGVTGTEVAKDAASMVLTDDNFATIVKAIETGRNVYANIKKSIQFLLSGNTAGILSVLYACLAGLAVPFAPVHLLFINLLTDSLPAIALGLDRHSSEVMGEKPRPKGESILTRDFTLSFLTEGLVIALFTMIAFHIGLRTSPELGRTMAFSTLCLSRLVHGYNCKSSHPVLFHREMWNNLYLNLAFLLGVALLGAVLVIPPLEPLFQVAPVSPANLLTICLCALGNLVVIQLLKLLRARMRQG